jgi:polysaccharide export outer membrane protein
MFLQEFNGPAMITSVLSNQYFPTLFRRVLLLTVAGLFSTALSQPQQVPIGPPPTPPQESPASPNKGPVPAMPPKSEGSAAVSSDYKVGPADVMKINVWSEDKFSGLFTVDQDGNFVYPLVGTLKAGGLTTAEIKDSVEKSLAKYVVKPRVDVIVQEVQSKKYYLNGLVSHPGEYLLAVPTTILQAISKAGGLQDFANEKKIYILRGTTKIPFNYKEVSQGKKMEQNVLLQPGDQVFVP